MCFLHAISLTYVHFYKNYSTCVEILHFQLTAVLVIVHLCFHKDNFLRKRKSNALGTGILFSFFFFVRCHMQNVPRGAHARLNLFR